MRITSFHREANHLLLLTTDGRIRLEVLGPRIIRVVYTRRGQFAARQSLMVLPPRDGSAEYTDWTVHDIGPSLMVCTPELELEISPGSEAFTWRDARGELLVREPRGDSKLLDEIEVPGRAAYSTTLRLEFSPGEAIYGLGQHEEGILNYRGRHQYLYQQNMKVAAPIIVSTRGYGILWDTCSLATFRDDQHSSYFWTEIDDEMDFYFIYGPEFDAIVAGCRRLTGKVPMLPKWAYGYLQSKERYRTADELLEVVREYRRRQIPLDCIVQDWMTWPGELWGQKSFDPQRYPDPGRLCEDLHRLNARLMVSVWPIMRNNGPNHVEMREQRCLLGNDATYDAFNPEARRLYWKQAHEGYFRYGVDAWWADCTEPFESDWRGAVKPQPERRVVINTEEPRKYMDPGLINAYSLVHTRGLYEGQRQANSQKRVVILTRSAYPGQQRYGAVTWSGDISANWDTLRRQIPDGLNFCMTGNPRWTFDIGAFFVTRREQWYWRGDYPDGCEDQGYRELYVRWLQLGAFLPMFRSHGTDTPREVWRFGQPGDAVYDTIVRFIRLRYRLLPYIYSLAGWEALRDYTMMRALAFDFRHDPAVYDIADQFMFGPALMVCPVTKPMYYGPGSRKLDGIGKMRDVYLPAGTGWYDFWTGRRYDGGQMIHAAAPLETMPLYVRSGSLLPMGPAIQHTGEEADAAWELRIYPGADGSFEIYNDEGDGYDHERGARELVRLAWADAARRLSFGDRRGSYRGMAARRNFEVVFVRPGHGAGVQAATDPDATVTYAGEALDLNLVPRA